jgi:hypothetical protein
MTKPIKPKEPWVLLAFLLLFLFAILTTGCASAPQMVSVPVRVPLRCQSDTISVDPINVEYPKFDYVRVDGNVYVTLTGRNYEILAKNTRSTINHIKQKNQKILFLQRCIDKHNKLSEEGSLPEIPP